MRKLLLTLAASAWLMPGVAFAQSIQFGPNGVQFDDGRPQASARQCEQLRRACENKDRLGEQGQGNCREYRETCRPQRRQVNCEQLRSACLNKDRLGEQGEGNCRQYRESCRR